MRFPGAILAVILFAGCPAPKSAFEAETSVKEQGADAKPMTAADYHGVWSTVDENGERFDIVIFSNGQAAVTWTKGVAKTKGERGFWRMDGNRLMVFQGDGWSDVLMPQGNEVRHEGFSPGVPLNAKPTNSAPATRLDGTVAEFSGVWRLNKEPDGSYLYVTLCSDGRAFSTVGGGTEGKWDAAEGAATCRWPDGWVDVIERGKDGYQKRSWVGESAEQTTPPDISPAIRVGETRFTIIP